MSKTATGMANASETALQRSTSGCSRGRVPSLRKRRSNDSEAHRYCVGLSPIAAKARRQAWISGSSLSVAVASRAAAAEMNAAARTSVATPGVIPSATRTPGTSAGKSRQSSGECSKLVACRPVPAPLSPIAAPRVELGIRLQRGEVGEPVGCGEQRRDRTDVPDLVLGQAGRPCSRDVGVAEHLRLAGQREGEIDDGAASLVELCSPGIYGHPVGQLRIPGADPQDRSMG